MKEKGKNRDKKKLTFYSDEFKKKVVQEVFSGKFTKSSAQRFYKIKSNSAILYWIRKFNGDNLNWKIVNNYVDKETSNHLI